MLTRKDKDYLQKTFATKSDLEPFATKSDLEPFATKSDLEPIKKDISSIKKGIRQLNKKQTEAIRLFDNTANYHHRRLEQLEEKAGIKPPPFVAHVS